jgi:hypothetical protein
MDGVEGKPHVFVTSGIDGGKWAASRPGSGRSSGGQRVGSRVHRSLIQTTVRMVVGYLVIIDQ